MDIIIIAQYLRNISYFDDNNSRFVYLSRMLSDMGNDVEIITSDFEHSTKRHFQSVGKLNNVKITVCHESGYPTNICLKRFFSHAELARNVFRYLSKRRCPDVLYVAVPSLDVAKVAAKYCKINNIRFIVDIQDIWPEAFKLKLNIPIVSDIVFAPFMIEANYIYKQADEIIAVSDTYAKRGMKANTKCRKSHTVFLGTDFCNFDNYKENNLVKKPDDELWVGYVGTLGASYDITCVSHAIQIINNDKEAMNMLHRAGFNRIVFQVIGDGPQKKYFEEDAQKVNIATNFTGSLSYPEMVGRLCACDVAVNPINHGASQSIINKVGDYAAASLCVINTLENSEYRHLIKQYHCGFNCKANNSKSVAKALKKWIGFTAKTREIIGKNSRRLGEIKFNRKKTYNEIVELIEKRN